MGVDVIGIYLAAGRSKRMGQNKLALSLRGKAIGAHGLQAAIESQIGKIIVVLNEEMDNTWVAPYLNNKKVHLVTCPKSNEGQAASIRCGLKEAQKDNPAGVIIQLADQPFVRKEVLDELVHQFDLSSQGNLRFHYIGYQVDKVIQPPILLGRPMFPYLLTLKGDQGARYLLKEGEIKGILMECPSASTFIDIDTWDAYQSMMNRF